MRLSPGTRLGPYEVVSALGAGGMGEVYRARDTRLDRIVAIKVLPETLAADPQFRERFDREARAISQLTHPHICTLYDVGEHAGIAYLVMELLEGESLERRLTKGALPIDQALKAAIELVSALDKAHRAGIVHRDLKPGNIMLTKSGAKLLDFGLVKAETSVIAGPELSMLPTAPPNLTGQGAILGTFQYMAPEQLEGQEADARTDIFAFGTVLYEMLTGRKAFEGKSQANLIAAVLERQPSPISTLQPSVPPALDRIVTRCLAKDRDDRWQSVRDLWAELNWVNEGASSPSVANQSQKRRAVQRLIAGFAVVLAVGLLTVRPLLIRSLRAPVTVQGSVRFTVPLPELTAFAALPPISVSPDGSAIAFAAQSNGTARILIRHLDEAESQALAGTEGASLGGFPIWSPDSKSLAFVNSQRRTLQRVDLTGGPSITISPLPLVEGVGASPSGTWNREGQILVAGTSGGIFRVSAANGQAVPLTFSSTDDGFGLSPVFLADGRRFIYTRSGVTEAGIYIGSLDSGDSRKLVPNAGTPQLTDGYLLYSRGGAILAQEFDQDKESLTGEPRVPVTGVAIGGGTGRAAFSASRNGVLVYATGNRQPTQFTWFSRTGERLGTVGDVGVHQTLSISPDERTVVTGRSDPGGAQNLWAIDVARQVTTRLTFGQDRDSDGKWSPDGTRLIYASIRGIDKSLYEIPAAGGPSRVVLKSPDNRQLSMDAWSPDGRTILYHMDVVRELWALPLAKEAKPFLVYKPPNGTVDEPAFSPDGQWLAFNSTESGASQVYVIPFPPTGAKRQISATGGAQPQWRRRDGRELYFLAPDGNMMAVDIRLGEPLDAGTPHALFPTNVVPSSNLDQFVVTADGRRFLVMTPVGPAQTEAIEVITHWPSLPAGAP